MRDAPTPDSLLEACEAIDRYRERKRDWLTPLSVAEVWEAVDTLSVEARVVVAQAVLVGTMKYGPLPGTRVPRQKPAASYDHNTISNAAAYGLSIRPLPDAA